MPSSPARFVSLLLVVALISAAPHRAHAQSATFAGTVMVDPTERPLANAEITFAALNRSVRSDSAGNFNLAGLPPGKYTVTVRMLGYDTFTAEITLGASEKVSADMLLKPATVSAAQSIAASLMENSPSTKLEAVSVSEKSPNRYGVRMDEFDSRRKSGSGRFITEEDFAKESGRTLSAIVIKRISGVRIQQVNGRRYIVTGRQGELRMNGTVMKGAKTADPSSLDQPRGCYAQVIVNGVMRYNGTPGQQLYDIDQLDPKDIIGFEYHTAATLPAQYNMTQSADAGSCGTAIIWVKGA